MRCSGNVDTGGAMMRMSCPQPVMPFCFHKTAEVYGGTAVSHLIQVLACQAQGSHNIDAWHSIP